MKCCKQDESYCMYENRLRSHGAKYACLYCEGERAMKRGKMRTFGGLRKRHRQFFESGGRLKDASKFANCINSPLLNKADDVRVISVLAGRATLAHWCSRHAHEPFDSDVWARVCRRTGQFCWSHPIRHGYQGMKNVMTWCAV